MGNFYVDLILEEKKITDFLQENGYHPVKKSGDKWIYLCPVHAGDSDPSFIVYPVGTKGRNYQTYHCFGCHSGINIINLKSDLDKVSIRDAVNFFLKGIDVDLTDATESIADSTIKEIDEDKKTIDEDKSIELLLMSLNIFCKEYLLEYGDEEEILFFEEKFYKKIDEIARSRDVDTLEEYYNMLIEKEVLVKRADAIRERREKEETSAVKWWI